MNRAIAVVALILASCAGPRARGLAFRPLKASLEPVASRVEVAIEEQSSNPKVADVRTSLANLRAAITSERIDLLDQVSGDLLHEWADRGVDVRVGRGEIHERVGVSLKTENAHFFDLLGRMR